MKKEKPKEKPMAGFRPCPDCHAMGKRGSYRTGWQKCKTCDGKGWLRI